jgi:hypothetical protein
MVKSRAKISFRQHHLREGPLGLGSCFRFYCNCLQIWTHATFEPPAVVSELPVIHIIYTYMINYIYLHMMRRFRGFRVCGLTVCSRVKWIFHSQVIPQRHPQNSCFFDCVFFGIFIGKIKKMKTKQKNMFISGKILSFSRFWTIPVFTKTIYLIFYLLCII